MFRPEINRHRRTTKKGVRRPSLSSSRLSTSTRLHDPSLGFGSQRAGAYEHGFRILKLDSKQPSLAHNGIYVQNSCGSVKCGSFRKATCKPTFVLLVLPTARTSEHSV